MGSFTTCCEVWRLPDEPRWEDVPTDDQPSKGQMGRWRLSLVFAGIVLIGLAIAWGLGRFGQGVATEGSPAPDFTVEVLAGGSFSLSRHLDSASGPLVLNLWASWCIPCRVEIPAISAFAASHPEVTVLGVAVRDEIEAARAFALELAPSYPLAFDDGQVSEAYPSLGLPATYVIDRTGVVRRIHNGIMDAQTLSELVAEAA